MKITLFYLSLIILVLTQISCEKEDETVIDSQEKAEELVGEINYMVSSNFPGSYYSWTLNNEVFYGDVGGTCSIDGSFTYCSSEGWSTYTSSRTYNNVYVIFENYQDRSDYYLLVNGVFNLDGTITTSGSTFGDPTTSGTQSLVGIFSVSGKFEGEDLELYLQKYSSTGVNYAAKLIVGDKEYTIQLVSKQYKNDFLLIHNPLYS